MDYSQPSARLFQAARAKDWDYVESNLRRELSGQNFLWALDFGLVDANGDVRELAAAFLEESGRPVEERYLDALMDAMAHDANPRVRYRLAIALAKRGSRDPFVRATLEDACADEDFQSRAEELLRARA